MFGNFLGCLPAFFYDIKLLTRLWLSSGRTESIKGQNSWLIGIRTNFYLFSVAAKSPEPAGCYLGVWNPSGPIATKLVIHMGESKGYFTISCPNCYQFITRGGRICLLQWERWILVKQAHKHCQWVRRLTLFYLYSRRLLLFLTMCRRGRQDNWEWEVKREQLCCRQGRCR